eukprot:COSAG01_NODE_34503_length_546_cov_1.541387_1_plen_68_part_10
MAIFKLLDMNEKTGWIERNAKREFMAHADTLLASEASLKKAITILREAIAAVCPGSRADVRTRGLRV